MQNEQSEITFDSFPATMGWVVTAIQDGERFTVACGLISPEPTLAWCRSNIREVQAAITKARNLQPA